MTINCRHRLLRLLQVLVWIHSDRQRGSRGVQEREMREVTVLRQGVLQLRLP